MAARRRDKHAETEVLIKSGRRCCLCFGLHRDFGVKRGQVAHLDRNPANSSVENLVFLCIEHHEEYDTRTSQSKGWTIQELVTYRTELYRYREMETLRSLPIVTDQLMQHLGPVLTSLAGISSEMAALKQDRDSFRKFMAVVDTKLDQLANEMQRLGKG